MLRNFAKPGSLVAVVSDSYNIYNAVQNIWGKELKEEVINSGATVIIRPDSGNPEVVVMKTLWALNEAYGSTVNSKGYKVLNNVRVIQGDGIGLEVIRNICYALMNEKFSLDNIAFGMGGGLLQKCNRDTLKFAMKLSAVKVDGEWKDVYKKPVGDISKASIPGKFKVVVGGDGYEVAKPDDPRPDAMDVVYETGIVKRFQYMEDIRKLAAV
jgi:nicotinamide phosphoribosyltransferase